MAKPPFDGHRTFTWFTPRRRAATEYELYTVGQQSSPEQWLHADWPIRFDDGREPYAASSTAIRCGNWPDYRDPAEITRLTRDVRDLRLRLLTRIPSLHRGPVRHRRGARDDGDPRVLDGQPPE